MIFPLSRRRFLSLAAGVAGVGRFRAFARDARAARTYSVVLLGDTHFDSVDTGHYHADYLFSTSEKRYRAHLREHVRNAEMWRAHMPALLKASAEPRSRVRRLRRARNGRTAADRVRPAAHRASPRVDDLRRRQ